MLYNCRTGDIMRKSVVGKLCVMFIIILLFVCTTVSVSSYSVYTYKTYDNYDNVTMLQNENQIYLIENNGKTVYIDAVYPQSFSVTLTLNNNVYSYNLCGDTLVLVCPIKESMQSEIVLYNISDDSFKSFNTTDAVQSENTQIAYSDGYVYLSDHYGNVKKYSSKGVLCNEYNLCKNACYLMCDYSGNIYATSYSGVFLLNADGYSKISDTAIGTAAVFIDDTTFVSATGYTYKIKNGAINQLISFKSTMAHPSGGVYKKHIICAQGNTIYAVSPSDDKAVKSISLSSNIEQLYVIDDVVIAYIYNSGCATISKITYSEFKDIKDSEGNSGNQGINNSDLELYNHTISSNIYIVNNNNYTISGISSPTTVAMFKRNMNYDGFDVEFVKYGGQSITSGNVGTATIARFYNDNSNYEYELCVEGDLTGEGNINTRDENVMFDCLLDNMDVFNGVFVQAADLDDNNNITVADLVLLLRAIESNK